MSNWKDWCEKVFFYEGIINLTSGIAIMLFPSFTLLSYGLPEENISPILEDVTRWFGSIVIILGWIGLFSPVSKGNIEGLLLGDLAWLWVLYIFIDNNVKTWTLCAFATGVALVVFLALTRIVYLISIRSSSKTNNNSNKNNKTKNTKINGKTIY